MAEGGDFVEAAARATAEPGPRMEDWQLQRMVRHLRKKQKRGELPEALIGLVNAGRRYQVEGAPEGAVKMHARKPKKRRD